MNNEKLPTWCKVGQWVTTSLEGSVARDNLHQIARIEKEVGLCMIFILGLNGKEAFGFDAENLKPVYFREYTFEEAKSLLGKVMEYNEDGILPAVAIIGMIWQDGSKVYYNGLSFKDLQRWNATIDGAPIGVPEIDEEALKGGYNA